MNLTPLILLFIISIFLPVIKSLCMLSFVRFKEMKIKYQRSVFKRGLPQTKLICGVRGDWEGHRGSQRASNMVSPSLCCIFDLRTFLYYVTFQ